MAMTKRYVLDPISEQEAELRPAGKLAWGEWGGGSPCQQRQLTS